MVTDVPTIAAPPVTNAATARGDSTGFHERWAATQATSTAHERTVRRKMALAASILLLLVAVVALYALVGR
jgi:hypothetical protein